MVSGPLDLGEEFVVEPAHQPAHFDARPGLARQQAVFADLDAACVSSRYSAMIPAPGTGGAAFLHQHRRGARRD